MEVIPMLPLFLAPQVRDSHRQQQAKSADGCDAILSPINTEFAENKS
jgi:hypothetical protein